MGQACRGCLPRTSRAPLGAHSLGAAVIVALILAAPAATCSRPTLADVAAFVAGKPVTITCRPNLGGPASAPTLGLTLTVSGASTITLDKRLVCDPARKAIADPGGVGLLLGITGLLALVHEGEHARGHLDETETECAALRIFPRVLTLIGVPNSLRKAALIGARTVDQGLPPVYHEHPC